MEINIENKLYVYDQLKPEITRLININECITICGLPYIGKSRLLKQLVCENKWESTTTFINLDTITLASGSQDLLNAIKSELENLYEKGKRIFIVQYINLDSQNIGQISELIYRFRQSCLETPSFIFFLSTHPNFYADELKNCRIIFSNILYYKINSREHNEFLRKQNEYRFDTTINNDTYAEILKQSGGISSLFKAFFQQKLGEDQIHNSSTINSVVRSLLDEIPDREIELLRKSTLTDFEHQHLNNEGVIDDKGRVVSTILASSLDDYSRDYEVNIFQNDIYINGNVKTGHFTEIERAILNKLSNHELLERDDVARLASGEENYLDYSEAAIDKLISRLRSKLTTLGVKKDFLKTVKGKGFKIDES